MHSKKPLLILLLCLVVTADLVSCQEADNDSDLEDLLEDEPLEVVIEGKSQMKFYKFTYSDLKDEKFDLSVTASPINSRSDPDVYVSTTSHHPNEQDNEYSDFSYGFDMVSIPYDDFKTSPKTFYIGVQCQSERCDFILNAIRTDRFSLSIYEKAKLTFEEDESGTVVFKIPKDDSADRIILIATILNAYSLNRGIHVYINEGEQLPSSSRYDIAATSGWFDGKAAVISKDEPHFCTGCSYTVVVEAEKGTIMTMEAKLYGNQTSISLGDSRYDALDTDHTMTYILDVSKAQNLLNDTLSVQIKPYTGAAAIYVHLGEQPEDLADYKWSAFSYGQESLNIPADELQSIKGNYSNIYITVKALLTTTYRFFVTGFSNYTASLYPGMSESGYMLDNQKINYRFTPWGVEDTDITLTLSSKAGNPDLFLISCSGKPDCEVTDEMIKDYYSGKIKQSKEYPLFLVSDKKVGDDRVTFHHDPILCPSSPGARATTSSFSVCLYAIAVITQDQVGQETHYTLTAKTAGSHVHLIENEPFRSQVGIDAEEYYYLTIIDDTHIESLSIQVTPISGIVHVYASSEEKYPSLEKHQIASYLNGMITFTKEDVYDKSLNHTYYLTVRGHTASTYTLLATVNYTAEIPTVDEVPSDFFSLTQLYNGIPQKVVMKEHELKYFKFPVNLNEEMNQDEQPSLRVNLQPLQGQFKMYASANGQIPSDELYQFSSSNNILYIDQHTREFEPNATYYVAVYPQEGSSEHLKELSFVLTYVTSSNFIWLRSGQTFSDIIDSERRMYFRIEASILTKSIKITKNGDNRKLDLYVSLKRKNTLPSPDSFDISTSQLDSDYINISQDQIRKLCEEDATYSQDEDFENPKKCYIHMAAVTQSDTKVHFNLLVQEDNSMIQIQKSKALELPFPSNESEPLNLYFVPDTREDIEIIASSPFYELSAYADIINGNQTNQQEEWQFPSSFLSDFSSTSDLSTHKTSIIKIPQEKLDSCIIQGHISCVVLLTLVKASNTSVFNYTAVEVPKGLITETFSVIVATEVIPLPISKPLISSVEEKQYRYFSFRVVDEECTLLISVTPLSNGDPDIVVSKGEDERPAFDLYNYDFSSDSIAGEQLEISNSDFQPVRTMEGVWVVGVYGYTKCRFSITVTYERHKMLYLYSSIPQNVQVKSDDILYFKYYNYKPKFDIILIPESGAGIIRANTFVKTEQILNRLPISDDAMYSSYNENDRERITIQEDSRGYCKDCYYLIGIHAEQGLDFSGTLIVLGDDEIIHLQKGKSFFYEVNQYSYQNFIFQDLTPEPQSFELAVVVYTGNPVVYVSHYPFPKQESYEWTLDCNVHKMGVDNSARTFSLVVDDKEYWSNHENKESVVTRNGQNFTVSDDNFYLSVYGAETSKFSIIMTTYTHGTTLRDGIPESGVLTPDNKRAYNYYSTTDAGQYSKQRIKVLISFYDPSMYQDVLRDAEEYELTTVPEFKAFYSNMKKGVDEDSQELQLYRVSVSKGNLNSNLRAQITFSVEERKGMYSFWMKNINAYVLSFAITVQHHQFLKLPINTYQMSRIDMGASEVYEVFIEKKGYISIDVFPCFGRVEVDASRFFADAQENRFTEKTARAAESHLTRNMYVAPGMLYVRVRGLDGYIDDNKDPIKGALYKIRISSLGEDDKIPQEKFWMRSSGSISWKVSSDTLNLNWDHVGYEPSEVKKLMNDYRLNIKYKLVLADDPVIAESMAICQVLPNKQGQFSGRGRTWETELENIELSKFTVDTLDSIDKEVSINEDERNYASFVTILATVQGSDTSGKVLWEVPIKYDTLQINFEKSYHSSSIQIILVLVLIGLIAMVIFVVCYVRKYRNFDSMLRYELQDVRNVAQVGGSNDYERSQKEKYTSLMSGQPDTM